MAAHLARSPITPLSIEIIPNPTQSRNKPIISVKFLKRCRNLTVLASTQGDSDASVNSNKNFQALELQKILNDSIYDVVSKDSPLLPSNEPRHHNEPLSSSRFSSSASDGPGLRVAYQGFPGAYSESAAKKAYPNCEAVPCEQFDTAFEVNA